MSPDNLAKLGSTVLTGLLPTLSAAIVTTVKQHVADIGAELTTLAKSFASHNPDVKTAVLASITAHAKTVEEQANAVLRALGADILGSAVVQEAVAKADTVVDKIEKAVVNDFHNVENFVGGKIKSVEAIGSAIGSDVAALAAPVSLTNINKDIAAIKNDLTSVHTLISKVPHIGWVVSAGTGLMTAFGALGWLLHRSFGG